MSNEFIRRDNLQNMSSYPQWVRILVEKCSLGRESVIYHDFFQRMRDARLCNQANRRFLTAIWPTIVQFPQYLALNLLKVQYGHSRGHDLARKYLIRNIRAEQSHADMWLDWAQAYGLSREEIINNSSSGITPVLSQWCWNVCANDELAPAIAATNYAIEGATAEWAKLVCSREDYMHGIPESHRKPATRWLRQHVRYNDSHSWEALEIIATLLGQKTPPSNILAHIEHCILTSYMHMRSILDDCLSECTISDQRSSFVA